MSPVPTPSESMRTRSPLKPRMTGRLEPGPNEEDVMPGSHISVSPSAGWILSCRSSALNSDRDWMSRVSIKGAVSSARTTISSRINRLVEAGTFSCALPLTAIRSADATRHWSNGKLLGRRCSYSRLRWRKALLQMRRAHDLIWSVQTMPTGMNPSSRHRNQWRRTIILAIRYCKRFAVL